MNHRDYVMQIFKPWTERTKLKGSKLLDVGSKGGELKKELETLGFEWYGIDKEPTDKVVTGGLMEELPYDTESFDVIFVCHAFEHCEVPIHALREFWRVLKQGGHVFVATPNPVEHQVLNADPDHVMCLNPMQFMRLLTYTGFVDNRSFLQEHDGRLQDFNVVSIGRKP